MFWASAKSSLAGAGGAERASVKVASPTYSVTEIR